MKISLDVDGVLADIILPWLTRFNKVSGTSLLKSDVTSWDFWRMIGITIEEFYRTLSEAWIDWRVVPSTEENLSDKVALLRSLGRVDIVTGRMRGTHGYVKKWLASKGVKYEEFVPVPPSMMKSDLDYDVFIDDAPDNATGASKKGKYVVLYDQPWNKVVQQGDRIIRVRDLMEALRVIRSLKTSF